MQILIELTTRSEKVWVNPHYISSLCGFGTGSRVFIANDPSPVIVRESPEAVIQKISVLK